MKSIGVIYTQLNEKKNTPIQYSRSDIPGKVGMYPQYKKGLDIIENFFHDNLGNLQSKRLIASVIYDAIGVWMRELPYTSERVKIALL
jgi:hypothetical protein